MDTTRLLIDGDILIYKTCWAVQSEVEWEDGIVTTGTNLDELKIQASATVEYLKLTMKPDETVICLSDKSNNFRKKIFTEYKAHRKKNRKPLGFKHLQEYLIKQYTSRTLPTLEADDVMGILATDGQFEKNYIASIDKDMTTVPCTYYNLDSEDYIAINTNTADFNFHVQTLTGDAADNYKGCPGIGIKRALGLLFGKKPNEYWGIIKKAFEKVGLTEMDALVQARMARILRTEDYNMEKGEVLLWSPR
jgi:DNA polymerase-1